MSVDGIGGIGGYTGIRPGAPRPTSTPGEGITPAPVERQPAPEPAPQVRPNALPIDAPSGTDPQLWSVLTSEERTFFARARAMGPLTYGPGAQGTGSAGPARGGRVDIRI